MRKTLRTFFLCFTLLFSAPARAEDVASAPESVRPRSIGTFVPEAAIQTLTGEATTVSKVLNGKPSIVLFYRGGW